YLRSLSLEYAMKIFHGELRAYAKNNITPSHKPPTRMKGDISTFSKKSRRRMFRMMNRVRWYELAESIFITCTCRASAVDPQELHYKFHKHFLPALKKAVPGITGLWRMEAHNSGYPHLHLIATNHQCGKKMHSEYWKRKIRRLWRDVIDQHDSASKQNACWIENLEDEQQ